MLYSVQVYYLPISKSIFCSHIITFICLISQPPWQVTLRLREFATVRAMECHTIAAAAASNAAGDSAAVLDVAMLAGQGVESGRPCQLRLRTEQVAQGSNLIPCKEALGPHLGLIIACPFSENVMLQSHSRICPSTFACESLGLPFFSSGGMVLCVVTSCAKDAGNKLYHTS
jgi:hypothetical protein